nr:MAG: hypothetical protein 2 [Leviviridae sp.]
MSIVLKDTAGGNVTYNIYRKESDRATYVGPAHTDLIKDQLVVTSVSPKQTVGSYGNRRSSVNLLTSVSVATPSGETATRDLKVEVIVSLPAGITFAVLDQALSRIAEAVSNDAIATDLFYIGKIER